MANDLTSRIWLSDGMNYTWPEQQAPYNVGTGVGICLSGGGSRAFSAGMGQLRALVSKGLMGSIDYISCVSGGSWAAALFAYYRAGATSDAEFLGPDTQPEEITSLEGLKKLSTNCMGSAMTLDFISRILRYKVELKDDEVWIASVGDTFFDVFGLWDPKNPAYFSLDDATVAAIKAANPSLAGATFNTVRTPSDYKMPFLVINSTVDGPVSNEPYDPDSLVAMQYTPLYVGVPYQQQVSYLGKKPISATVGGGFIEPFAFGGGSPTSVPSNGTVTVPAPATPFTVVDASGASSAAFGAIFVRYKWLEDFLPEESYWPPMSGATPLATPFLFGDGGNLENYGLISLLLRGVQNVIVFMNTESKLDTSYDPTKSNPTSADIDPNFPPLFGYPLSGMSPSVTNTVFLQSEFAGIVTALQTAKKAGGPVMTKSTLAVQPNAWWGLAGGWNVNILWVYLEMDEKWKSLIADPIVRAEIDAGDLGGFAHFPNYKTIDQDGPGSLTRLTPQQVNLLADMTCWIVEQNIDQFKAMIPPG